MTIKDDISALLEGSDPYPHCTGCNEGLYDYNWNLRDGGDGEYILMCRMCGQIMFTNGKGGARDLTRPEWTKLPTFNCFDAIIAAREEIVKGMIG